MIDKRIKNEIEHGKYLKEHGAGEIWGWETPAGKIRWARRVKMLTSFISKDMRVLEIGCGTGYFTKELVKTGAQITAIDISPDLLEIAKNSIDAKNVRFEIQNAYAMEFKENSFDIVVGSSVLHHLEIDTALSEIYKILNGGGKICFTEPNMLNPQIALQKNIPYLKRKLGDSPDESAFFKWQIVNKLKKHGFVDIVVEPFDFLHPSIPESLIKYLKPICDIAEKIPLLKEIAGSLYIRAKKA